VKKARSAIRRGSSRARKRTASVARRVKRVTQEVVSQATTAVSAGVDTIRDLGENLVDRVRTT
jgi:hypothetical protein